MMKKGLYYLLSLTLLAGCFQPLALFDEYPEEENVEKIGNFYSTQIFSDNISKEIWTVEGTDCVVAKRDDEISFSGKSSLHITWDKLKGNCPGWLGMGFGWDGWSGKNLSKIYDKSAIQFKVRTAEDTLRLLPIAMCLEDYGDLQAWTGFSRKMLDSEYITDQEWSTVTIPILEFGWEEFGADVSNVKQFMIQFEAAGDIFIDDIKIIKHQGSLRKRAKVVADSESIFNLKLTSSLKPTMRIDDNPVYITLNSTDLFIGAVIEDETPLENSKNGDKIWDGDAIEVAFSTDPAASPRRKRFLMSDQQIGIKITDKPIIWNWRKHREVKEGKVYTELTNTGYIVKAKIPLSEFELEKFEVNRVYGLEVALDQGNKNGRVTQTRWNSTDREGFHTDPSLWGELLISDY